jgi:hypothetical protein
MKAAPSPNGLQDRDARGRFAPGNAGGPGNPLGGQVARLRAALIEAVTEDDMAAIARKLIEMAKGGDVTAIRELLTRVLGRPLETDLIERMERIEARLAEDVR